MFILDACDTNPSFIHTKTSSSGTVGRHGARPFFLETIEVHRSKLRHDDAGRQRKKKMLSKLLRANDNNIPVIFVNFICNL
jgi:phosphopentomutase